MDINNNVAGDEKRRSSRRVHPESLQENCDFLYVAAAQEQIAFTPLPCIESEEESATSDEELDSEAYGDNYNYYEYFSSRGTDAELGFLEEEYENSQMDMEIDPDELSYEQLIELGEFIGEEKRGLSIEQISGCISAITYQTVDIRTGTDRCVVCQVEFEEGEQLVGLICKHSYHKECISNWLQIKKVCPICNIEVN